MNQPPFRIVTAAAIFDGHDAAINLFRRLLQQAGMEIIHLGHNRSVYEIVMTAIQEDADAICISSYQGGHLEFYQEILNSLKQLNATNILVFGGGGGTILPKEIKFLEKQGITRIYHPEDGRSLGLQGIIQDIHFHLKSKKKDTFCLPKTIDHNINDLTLGKILTELDQGRHQLKDLKTIVSPLRKKRAPIIGFTGPGGAGKSSFIDEWIGRYLQTSSQGRVALLAFDPTKQKTGGGLLADRLRMNFIYNGRCFVRSFATKTKGACLTDSAYDCAYFLSLLDFDVILVETSGAGQSESSIKEFCDHCVYIMTPEYGSSTQLEKIDMLDFADTIILNKSDILGAQSAWDDIAYLCKKNRYDSMPAIFLTCASQFNDDGINQAFEHMISNLEKKEFSIIKKRTSQLFQTTNKHFFNIIPHHRTHYLQEIVSTVRNYHQQTIEDASLIRRYDACKSLHLDLSSGKFNEEEHKKIDSLLKEITSFITTQKQYEADYLKIEIKGKQYEYPLKKTSLSDTKIPIIALPRLSHLDDILFFLREENLPGYYPFTNGTSFIKNPNEFPQRQFAGEGSPEKTNQRFHLLTKGSSSQRLSTAFDSVTLYGQDPQIRQDIYGKIGNSGVSIATLDHMKTLYQGFDLIAPSTSVSLTINGPAPILLAMFFNAAIDFEIEKQFHTKKRESISQEDYNCIKKNVLKKIRGTVQADILKEEQGQNTCIFSSRFALKMMGDVQEYFLKYDVKNFYSVSVSGYHIAEAGANPITQLAFTLANGFTYIEYYISRGMPLDDFCKNFSFFFSNGLDPEYTVMGRVARKIWAITLKNKYGAQTNNCRLKYHIQTSGRSLHAQEISFNDIRTTLQALLATFDHCNSLHTNAYDEAITTPTDESVRRAMAIQMIINQELGLTNCENVLSGSYFITTLCELVEEAVLKELEKISQRGGVLNAMERHYQRHKIQDESMKYEMKKNSGELPLIGVNTFLQNTTHYDYDSIDVRRATDEEKQKQITSTQEFIAQSECNFEALNQLKKTALSGGNIFEELMETVKHASLGQITSILYSCGGEYRRSM